MDCSPLGSSVHGFLQVRILEWVAILFFRGSSQLRNQTWVSCIAGRFFTTWSPFQWQLRLNTPPNVYCLNFSLGQINGTCSSTIFQWRNYWPKQMFLVGQTCASCGIISILLLWRNWIIQLMLLLCSKRRPDVWGSVQSLSCVWLFATPWIAARQASLSITKSQSSLRLTSIESVMPSSHLILCRPLLLLPPIPPSMSLFQWVNSLHEVAKVLEFQL